MDEFLKAFTFIFIAEMGDKSQILAMTFATKYKLEKVLVGIFLGILLNHSLAVFVGAQLTTFIPLSAIQIIAGFMFLLFGMMSLKVDTEEDLENPKNQIRGVIITVMTAFFIGELGDKTQLATTTLATESLYPIITLAGSVSAMMTTALLGILVGMKFGKSVPDTLIKLFSAFIFAFFGYQKLLSMSFDAGWVKTLVYFGLLCSIILYGVAFQKFLSMLKSKRQTAFAKAAEDLQRTTELLKHSLSELCLSETLCGPCENGFCAIGQAKSIIDSILTSQHIPVNRKAMAVNYHKTFNEDKLIKTLFILSHYLYLEKPEKTALTSLTQVKSNLEMILFNAANPTLDLEDYLDWLKEREHLLALKLREELKEIKE
jgi:putative Ca2+/H+ antiporter (TMEM165/GDT1 family)